MLHYVHSNFIYNKQKLERMKMFLSREMGTANVIHLHNGVLHNYKNNEFMIFKDKWMDLEDIYVSQREN